MSRWTRTGDVVVLCLLACPALALGISLHPMAVDDAFVTFRYAQNLAAGHGFAYNPGSAVLSTTAPLYALILAAGGLLWPDLPALANTLSALAIWSGAALVFVLGRREGTPWVGALAALLFVIQPLLWLSLGLETSVFLALALGGIVTYRSGHLYWAATLLALATLTRGDGLILTAVIAADYALRWLSSRRSAPAKATKVWRGARSLWALAPAGVYLLVLLPLALWLTVQFGSPLPATLGAKVSQSELGVTGFYPHTSYLQGLAILIRARLAQSPFYLLFVPAVLAGLVTMWWRGAWVRLMVAWGAAQLAGYAVLGVTPYYWYYAPLVPALVCTSALGAVGSTRWLAQLRPMRQRAGRAVALILGGLWAASLVTAYLISGSAMVQGLDGPLPPPEDPVSKVLPEAKVEIYRQAGQWLRENTPEAALVGVTEVGVMGYYAGRPMVDFLGLLEPEVAGALARGDLYWALLRYQPDYLALTAISPLYTYDLRADSWFQTAYAPVKTLADSRFWGSPVTIYKRRAERIALAETVSGGLPEGAIELGRDFGGQIRLLGAMTGDDTVQPGGILPLTLYWQALGPVEHDYTVFVHLLGQAERVIAQRDAPPGLGAAATSGWTPGQVVADPYLVTLPEVAYAPDQAVWEVGLYEAESGQRLPSTDGGDHVRFGSIAVQPAHAPRHLDFGQVVMTGYEIDRLALGPGDTLRLRLGWDLTEEGAGPVLVTVQLVSEAGEVEAQARGQLEEALQDGEPYELALGKGAAPGVYDLEVLVLDANTGTGLPLLGADGQRQGERARLTKIRLYP